MLMKILGIIHLVVAVLLIAVVLLQQKGAGMGSAFGGSNAVYSTRRGLDKTLFQATIVLAVIFFGTAIAFLFIK